MSAQAKRAYEAYREGIAGDGVLAHWDALPARVQEAWRAAVVAAVDEPEAKKETLTDVQVRLLQEQGTAAIAKKVRELVPSDQGFVLITAGYGPRSSLAYVSTINRDDTVRLLREWLKKEGAL